MEALMRNAKFAAKFAPDSSRPGFDYVSRDGKIGLELKLGAIGVRDLHAAAIQVALYAAERDVVRACLVVLPQRTTVDRIIEEWSGGDQNCCRLLVGMQRLEEEELRRTLSVTEAENGIDNQAAIRLKADMAHKFRNQLTHGCPTNEDEAGLRRLAAQIKAKKLVVKLFLRHPLHAKLYLLFRTDPNSPIVGFLGSSNLTMAGLSHQGELNVDVLDYDAAQKLARWFEDRSAVSTSCT